MIKAEARRNDGELIRWLYFCVNDYFRELHKLDINDIAIIYYKGIKYTYKVDKIYDVLKDGDVEVERDKDKTTLTLITCKKNTKDRHLVIILYLEKMEEY